MPNVKCISEIVRKYDMRCVLYAKRHFTNCLSSSSSSSSSCVYTTCVHTRTFTENA